MKDVTLIEFKKIIQDIFHSTKNKYETCDPTYGGRLRDIDRLRALLEKHFKCILAVEGIREYEFNDEYNLLYSLNSAICYRKYLVGSPLPWSIEVNSLIKDVEEQISKNKINE